MAKSKAWRPHLGDGYGGVSTAYIPRARRRGHNPIALGALGVGFTIALYFFAAPAVAVFRALVHSL